MNMRWQVLRGGVALVAMTLFGSWNALQPHRDAAPSSVVLICEQPRQVPVAAPSIQQPTVSAWRLMLPGQVRQAKASQTAI